jgi:hypothetical protein
MAVIVAVAAAEASGREQKDQADDDEAADDQGLLDASPSDGESRIHSHGGYGDVHFGAPVATATSRSLDPPRYNNIADGDSSI